MTRCWLLEALLLLLLPLCSGGGRLRGAQLVGGGGQGEGDCGGQQECVWFQNQHQQLLVCLLQASQRSQIICKFVVQINYVSDCLNLDKYMEFSKSIIGICLSVWPWPHTRTTFVNDGEEILHQLPHGGWCWRRDDAALVPGQDQGGVALDVRLHHHGRVVEVDDAQPACVYIISERGSVLGFTQ